jgi:hypothetical protein
VTRDREALSSRASDIEESTPAPGGRHNGWMRGLLLACLVGLGSWACGGGGVVPAGADAAPGDAASTSSSGGGEGGCVALPPAAPGGAVGAPCVSSVHEGQASFAGFDESDVTIETNNAQCGTNVCLYNHFRGRVTCPYGQDATGHGPHGTPGCLSAGSCEPVESSNPSQSPLVVAPQCADRTAAVAVYCSCRCANASGGTSDGTYCTCPSGTTCTQLIPSRGPPPAGKVDTSGAYCLKLGTEWGGGICSVSCDPTSAPCP